MSAPSVRLKPRTENLTGREFGFLTVLRFAGYAPRAKWVCCCKCGNEKSIGGYDLKRGHIVSCGCGIKSRVESPVELRPEWNCYRHMIERCCNPNANSFDYYGGRGISVCVRWVEGFAAFLEDIGPRPSHLHSLDRYPDQDGNYEPGNVRWATAKQQARNRRSNHIIEFRGESRTIVEWSEIVGVAYRTLLTRINTGWTAERALTSPADRTAGRFGATYQKQSGLRGTRLPSSLVSEARTRHAKGESTRSLAKSLGIGKSTAYDIIAYKGAYDGDQSPTDSS